MNLKIKITLASFSGRNKSITNTIPNYTLLGPGGFHRLAILAEICPLSRLTSKSTVPSVYFRDSRQYAVISTKQFFNKWKSRVIDESKWFFINSKIRWIAHITSNLKNYISLNGRKVKIPLLARTLVKSNFFRSLETPCFSLLLVDTM